MPVKINPSDGVLELDHQKIGSLSSIQKELSQLGDLRVLSMSNTSLTSLEGFPALESLQKIYLADNKIADANILKHCKNIQELDLSNNRISSLDAVKDLTELGLQHLVLENNPLKNYKDEVWSMFKDLVSLDRLTKDGEEVDLDDDSEEEGEDEYEEDSELEGSKESEDSEESEESEEESGDEDELEEGNLKRKADSEEDASNKKQK